MAQTFGAIQINTHNNLYSTSSPTPPPPSDNANANRQPTKHRRGYQACEPCRGRKVACKMGDPDKPREGKCDRCQREMKDCYFAPTRKKVRHSSEGTDGGTPQANNQRTTRGTKRKQSDASHDDFLQNTQPHQPQPIVDVHANNYARQVNGNGHGTFHMSHGTQSSNTTDHQSAQIPRSTPTLPRAAVNGSGIATAHNRLRAGLRDSGDSLVQSQVTAEAFAAPVVNTHQTLSALVKAAEAANKVSGDGTDNFRSPDGSSRHERTYSGLSVGGRNDVDPGIRDMQPDLDIERALRVWQGFGPVMRGLMSAEEAMNYVEYFYRNLAPMTPVKIPDFRAPKKHHQLLTEERILAWTILTIASRQMPLRGSGAVTRSHEVHTKLWHGLQQRVQNLLWGQEQFGGGFYGASVAPLKESVTGQITWKGSLRTLGTIEALLLITDWQPRALHFPPDDLADDFIDLSSTYDQSTSAVKNEDRDSGVATAASTVLEPGWRSDRMSWMLLAIAQALSFELGVFDNNHDDCHNQHGPDSDCLRRRRLRRLVLLYVTQTSGRLGIKSSMTPEQDRDNVFDNDPMRHSDSIDTMQCCWLQLASIMYSANTNVFSSKERTRQLTASEDYKIEIAKLTPRLAEWKKFFNQVSYQFNPTMRHVLNMEYEYARMFINSVGFNKVVESWKANTRNESGPKVEGSILARIADENSHYISEVREASTNIVTNVLMGFAKTEQLKDAAIRTYLRAFAGMVFTLKLFSLGNHEAVIKDSFRLLDSIVVAMKTQVVDDVHISTTIAAQVDAFTTLVKSTMIRIRKPGNGSGPPSRGISRPQSPRHTTEPVSNYTIQDHRYTTQPEATSPDDPLANIEARPMIDFSEKTFMPPPNFGNGGDDNNNMNYDANIDPGMAAFDLNHDWFALPLDNILAQESGPVATGASGVGPLVGQRDMLDWLEPDDSMQGHWGGMSGTTSGTGYVGMDGYL